MLTTRQINHLNRLARRNLVVFDGGDGLLTLDEIKFLKRGEEMFDNIPARDDTWAVYFDGSSNWYELEDCKFFTLTPYGTKAF